MKQFLITAAAVALCGGVVAPQEKDEAAPKGEPQVFKAVIHVNFSDTERQKHGLKNVANILKEVREQFEIVPDRSDTAKVLCPRSAFWGYAFTQSLPAIRLRYQALLERACFTCWGSTTSG